MKLHIDLETYSDVNMAMSGADKYVSSPEFKIILFAYALNDSPVTIIDLDQEELPTFLYGLILSDTTTKAAHNAVFEMLCLSKHYGVKLNPKQWVCTMVKCLAAGLPAKLKLAAQALNLVEQKTHTTLINWFCKPDKNGNRRLGKDHPAKWEQFKMYCVQDVVVERVIDNTFSDNNVRWDWWCQDYHINRRGVAVDEAFVSNAIAVLNAETQCLVEEAKTITSLNNPNSLAQLKEWMTLEHWFVPDSLDKDHILEYLGRAQELKLHPDIIRVMKIRQQLGKTSVAKYDKMLTMLMPDTRVRGLFFFHGAHTGRGAGRGVQLQNLYKNKDNMLGEARNLVLEGQDPRFVFPEDIMSQLIRTSFIGNFAIADFSAIEARVLAWLAGEEWINEVFAGDGKLYEAQAAKMFNIPIEEVDKDLRSKGKVATLALGYAGGVQALYKMHFKGTDEEAAKIVKKYRAANPNIKKFWSLLEKSCRSVVQNGGDQIICQGKLKISRTNRWLSILLPSGREMKYFDPSLGERSRQSVNGQYNGLCLTYMSTNAQSQWVREDTYGGKLCENVVQAIAADILWESLMALRNEKVVMHVHDEIVVENMILEKLVAIMEKPIRWAPGLLLKADGFYSKYYKK